MLLRVLGAALLLAVIASVTLVGQAHGRPGCPDRAEPGCAARPIDGERRVSSARAAGAVGADGPPTAVLAAVVAVAAAAATGAAATVLEPRPVARRRRPEPVGRHRRSTRSGALSCGQLGGPGAVAVGSVGPRA